MPTAATRSRLRPVLIAVATLGPLILPACGSPETAPTAQPLGPPPPGHESWDQYFRQRREADRQLRDETHRRLEAGDLEPYRPEPPEGPDGG